MPWPKNSVPLDNTTRKHEQHLHQPRRDQRRRLGGLRHLPRHRRPEHYKDYILTMLFLKYISDVWQDHYDEYKKQYGDDPELIAEMLKNERFVLPASASFYALYDAAPRPATGELIDMALHAIEDANIDKLHDVFHNINFNSNKLGDEQQKNDILRHLLEDFAKPALDLRPSRVGKLDVIGNAYEFLIGNFASDARQEGRRVLHPARGVQPAGPAARPAARRRICDPACGSGSLLIKCGRLIRERTGSRNYALYGQEANGSTWALAKMNMFLHGEDNHPHRMGRHAPQPQAARRRRQPDALRRRRRQSALLAGQVGRTKDAEADTLQPLPARHAAHAPRATTPSSPT